MIILNKYLKKILSFNEPDFRECICNSCGSNFKSSSNITELFFTQSTILVLLCVKCKNMLKDRLDEEEN